MLWSLATLRLCLRLGVPRELFSFPRFDLFVSSSAAGAVTACRVALLLRGAAEGERDPFLAYFKPD